MILHTSQIITATGDGRLPFNSVADVAVTAFRVLTGPVPRNADLPLLGPELYSYDDVVALLSAKLRRKIEHTRVPEANLCVGNFRGPDEQVLSPIFCRPPYF